jgi:hypothetical protein
VKAGSTPSGIASVAEETTSVASGACASCGTVNDDDAKFCKSCGTKLLALVLAFFLPFSFFLFPAFAPAYAQFQMPDPKQMSGIPRPVTDLSAGHVSVRVIRGQLSNNVQGHPVEIHAGAKVLTEKTDENGRAEFSGVAAGTTVKAVTTVDGERLESQEFAWPGDAGIRVMLVATAPGGNAGAPASPPKSGSVLFGDQTRVIIERVDDALQVYYILEIRNPAQEPVIPPAAVTIELPSGATSPTVLNGGPKAVALGDRITVAGPFDPGPTSVEVAYRMPYSSGEVTIDQSLPLQLDGVAVLIRKTGELALTSPQLPAVQERNFEGDTYILAQGQKLAAGSTLSMSVSGLPHHTATPRRVALGLAIAVLLTAVWASAKPPRGASASRVKQLTGKREKIFSELVRLEQQRRAGQVDPARYAERRPALIAQLERVYRDLDADGGQGAPA